MTVTHPDKKKEERTKQQPCNKTLLTSSRKILHVLRMPQLLHTMPFSCTCMHVRQSDMKTNHEAHAVCRGTSALQAHFHCNNLGKSIATMACSRSRGQLSIMHAPTLCARCPKQNALTRSSAKIHCQLPGQPHLSRGELSHTPPSHTNS